jgi:hypothetical protein
VGLAFEAAWADYPRRLGKKEALRHFRASVKTDDDLAGIRRALQRYKANVAGKEEKYIQHGSRWFNEWRDWLDDAEPPQPEEGSAGFPAANCRCGHADYYHAELTGACAIRRDNHHAEDCKCERFNGGASS